jgi:3',5'-cyclic AMP phosphodiesterase CpdA
MYERLKKSLDDTLKKYSIVERSAVPDKIEKADCPLSFIVWGDPQISRLSPLRAARLHYAVEDIKESDADFDALVLAGDLTEYGETDEYEMLSHLLEPVADRFGSIFAVPGNHDIRLKDFKSQAKRFSSFLSGVKNGVANPKDRYWFSSDVNGYKFIMLGSDRSTFEGSYISDRQLKWLDNELKNADKGKPVFVFNHQPLKKTNGLPLTFLGKGKWRGSVGWDSDKLRAVFEKYNNVIYITGHLHYCTSEYTFEDCGAFKAINAPTVGVINHGPFKRFTQGLIFNVFEDRIEVRSRIFGEGVYTPNNIKNSQFTISIHKGE